MSGKSETTFEIAVLPGDGIGREVMPICTRLVAQAATAAGVTLAFDEFEAGATLYQRTGEAFPERARTRCRTVDAILLGAMGLPSVRYADGTEIAPQLDLRDDLTLSCGVRPVRTIPGGAAVLSDARSEKIDFVLIRESTEGFFAARKTGRIENDQTAYDTGVITRDTSEKLFEFAFALARKRREDGFPGRVTCVDKANVFSSLAFFRKIFHEVARRHPDIEADAAYVDATALNLVKRPWDFDVLVTENLFGDILSDLGAALIGGLGFAPSADIGEHHAVFQPCHGSAPDIAGMGVANPTAMVLSGAMMLEWLGHRHGLPRLETVAQAINDSVDAVYRTKSATPADLGGSDGTQAIADAIEQELGKRI